MADIKKYLQTNGQWKHILKIHTYIRIFPLSRLSFVLAQPRPLRIFSLKEEGEKEEFEKIN